MSDPTLSDIDFKDKMVLVWTTLNHFRIIRWHKINIFKSCISGPMFHPTIAQLAERETVEAKQLSLGHWFESGWSEIFFNSWISYFSSQFMMPLFTVYLAWINLFYEWVIWSSYFYDPIQNTHEKKSIPKFKFPYTIIIFLNGNIKRK